MRFQQMPNFDEVEQSFVSEIGLVPTCPPLEILRAYRQSVLPEDGQSKVGEHLAQCRLCQILLNDLPLLEGQSLTRAARDRIRENIPVRPQPSHRWYVASAVAAGLALVAFLLFAGRHHATAPQVAASAIPAVTVNLAIEKLPPPPEVKSELVFRGAVSSTDPDAEELAPAFAAYDREDYRLAATRFDQLTERFPGSDIPILYRGVSQLLYGNDPAALESLAQADAIAKPSRKDAASWYHAAAAVRVHSPDASALLQALCRRDNSGYARQACTVSSQAGEKGFK
jgi:hypothetical protein